MLFLPISISITAAQAQPSTKKKEAVPPTYPNATYHVSLTQWKNYRNPSLFEKGSFFPENIEPVYDAGQLRFVLEDMQFDEHIRLELYDGHTPQVR